MIRPRDGGFEYSEKEIEIMKSEIRRFSNLDIGGFVFGITKGKKLDIRRIVELVNLSDGKEICIHKAIDIIEDPVSEVNSLKNIGITRILSSGKALTAIDGKNTLLKMKEAAGSHISIMPAGKITSQNIDEIHSLLGCSEYHGRRIVPLI